MELQADPITDVWFRSRMTLSDIAGAIGLLDIRLDAEDYWAWAIGMLDGVKLDITRTHTQVPEDVDTRIFRLDNRPLSIDQKELLHSRLKGFVRGELYFGRWVYKQGNDYELQVVERDWGDS